MNADRPPHRLLQIASNHKKEEEEKKTGLGFSANFQQQSVESSPYRPVAIFQGT